MDGVGSQVAPACGKLLVMNAFKKAHFGHDEE
jgi:hypothetical protein